jgi:hypothetical protein
MRHVGGGRALVLGRRRPRAAPGPAASYGGLLAHPAPHPEPVEGSMGSNAELSGKRYRIRAHRFNGFTHAADFAGLHIVENHGRARSQHRDKTVYDVAAEACTVRGAIHEAQCTQAGAAQGSGDAVSLGILSCPWDTRSQQRDPRRCSSVSAGYTVASSRPPGSSIRAESPWSTGAWTTFWQTCPLWFSSAAGSDRSPRSHSTHTSLPDCPPPR